MDLISFYSVINTLIKLVTKNLKFTYKNPIQKQTLSMNKQKYHLIIQCVYKKAVVVLISQ